MKISNTNGEIVATTTTMSTQKPSFVTYQEYQLVTNDLKHTLLEINRNYQEIKKQVEIISMDRELLRDLYESIGGLRNALIAYDKHNESLAKETTQAAIKTQDVVEQTIEKKGDEIKESTDKIHESLKGKNVIIQSRSFLSRIFKKRAG